MSSASKSLLLTSLTSYYEKNKPHRDIFYEIIQGNSRLSLRILDWFVTHYARSNDIIYWIDDANGTYTEEYPEAGNINLRKFNLHFKYRAELQSYTKMFFDPFKRHERITFILDTEPLKVVSTTVGQLNFFRWALSNHVIDYITNHIVKIEDNMAVYHKELNKQKSTGKKAESKKKVESVKQTVLSAPYYIHFD